MAKAEAKTELVCPFCKLLAEMCECFEGKSDFLTHLNNARVEFLEAMKSLIESRIASIRKRAPGHKKATKIEVT
jgi:hypothetical protein